MYILKVLKKFQEKTLTISLAFMVIRKILIPKYFFTILLGTFYSAANLVLSLIRTKRIL